MFARAFCQESKNAFRFVSFRRVLLERNNFARISRFILVFVRNDKRTESRNNAIVGGGGGGDLSRADRAMKLRRDPKRFLLYSSV